MTDSVDWSKITGGEATLIVAFATALVRVVWGMTTAGLRWFSFWASAPVRTQRVDLGPYDDVKDILAIKCLVVRYGADDYLLTMASEQDRWEGRLQNRALKVRAHRQGERMWARISLPVHRRLGTQFITFIDARTAEAAQRIARNPQLIRDDPDKPGSPLHPRVEGRRLFFLLPSIPLVYAGGGRPPIGEGIRNNIFPPF